MDEKLAEIKELEQQYEQKTKQDKYEMEIKKNFIKMAEATQAVQEIIYAQQNILKYHDKPNKQLLVC